MARSTVGSGDIRVEIGFIATRTTSGSPVVIPPSSPPALLLARRNPPRRSPRWRRASVIAASIGSCTSEPGRRAASKPSPISTPFTAGIDISIPASRPSSLRSQLTWLPSPTTTPRATTSTSPPRVSPAFLASSIRRTISASTEGSSTRTSERSAASLRGTGSSAGRAAMTPPKRDDVAPDLDAELVEQPLGQRAGRDPGRGLPRAGALQDVAGVEPVVLEDAGQVGVARDGGGRPGGGAARPARRPRGP